jgi:hypothetical protein
MHFRGTVRAEGSHQGKSRRNADRFCAIDIPAQAVAARARGGIGGKAADGRNRRIERFLRSWLMKQNPCVIRRLLPTVARGSELRGRDSAVEIVCCAKDRCDRAAARFIDVGPPADRHSDRRESFREQVAVGTAPPAAT